MQKVKSIGRAVWPLYGLESTDTQAALVDASIDFT